MLILEERVEGLVRNSFILLSKTSCFHTLKFLECIFLPDSIFEVVVFFFSFFLG